MDENITLIITPLRFMSHLDEDLMFGWIDSIKSIKSYKGIGRELHMQLDSTNIPDKDLLEIMGLFKRYKFDISQLRVFKNETNKELFEH